MSLIVTPESLAEERANKFRALALPPGTVVASKEASEVMKEAKSDIDARRDAFVADLKAIDHPISKAIPPGYTLSYEAIDRIKLMAQATTRNQRRVLQKKFEKRDAEKPFVTFVKK